MNILVALKKSIKLLLPSQKSASKLTFLLNRELMLRRIVDRNIQ